MIEACVFDLDGTVVDTESAEYESVRLVWEEHGLPYPMERWAHIVGKAWAPVWVDELAEALGRPLDATALRRHQRALNAQILRHVVPRPGVLALIEQAVLRGIPLAIASNSDGAWVRARLGDLDLARHFGAVVTIDNVTDGKPHPEPFLAACRALQARPECSVAFEDSATGVRSAVAAGLFTVACPGPLTATHDLSPADLVVDSLEHVSVDTLADAVARGRRA